MAIKLLAVAVCCCFAVSSARASPPNYNDISQYFQNAYTTEPTNDVNNGKVLYSDDFVAQGEMNVVDQNEDNLIVDQPTNTTEEDLKQSDKANLTEVENNILPALDSFMSSLLEIVSKNETITDEETKKYSDFKSEVEKLIHTFEEELEKLKIKADKEQNELMVAANKAINEMEIAKYKSLMQLTPN